MVLVAASWGRRWCGLAAHPGREGGGPCERSYTVLSCCVARRYLDNGDEHRLLLSSDAT
jgi:hypothetical protein